MHKPFWQAGPTNQIGANTHKQELTQGPGPTQLQIFPQIILVFDISLEKFHRIGPCKYYGREKNA